MSIYKLIIFGFIFHLSTLDAQFKKRLFVDITNPHIKKLPLAILPFNKISKSQDSNIINKVKTTMEFDLKISGLFKLIPPTAFLKKEIDIKNFNSDDWKVLGTSGVIATRYFASPSKLIFEFRLFDVATAKLVVGKRYSGTMNDAKMMTHKFCNDVVEYYSGEKGIFTTKIAFVSNKTKNKEIYIMDFDADNIRQITWNKAINLAPAWSPDNRYITYTSFKYGNPDIWIADLKTSKHTRITSAKGLNTGASWHPDGKHLVYAASSQTRNGDTDLFLINLKTKKKIQLTRSRGIDISPVISRDGKKIAFVSGRVGQPHIFTMNIDGGNILRITIAGRYNAGPTWSPKMDKIVFAGWENDHFDLFMVNSNATNMERLTKYTKDNEEPSFSPDGRIIVFQSTRRSTKKSKKSDLFIIHSNGLGEEPLLTGYGQCSSPAWSNRFEN